jgi:hypothetical protein
MLKWSAEMATTRRDFIKSFGISIASLVLARSASSQASSAVATEQPSAHIPGNRPSCEGMNPFKPTTNSNQETTVITIERQRVENKVGETQEQPMTPFDRLEQDLCIDPSLPAHSRLRRCWENLNLANKHLSDPDWAGGSPHEMLINCHAATLKELVVMDELSQEVAGELHEAFLAAINYVFATAIPTV